MIHILVIKPIYGTWMKSLKQINYYYSLALIDHFSKYIYSYLLINKAIEIVVSKIKLFILSFGKCKIFQTDNGLEFKNNKLIGFLSNEGIKLY